MKSNDVKTFTILGCVYCPFRTPINKCELNLRKIVKSIFRGEVMSHCPLLRKRYEKQGIIYKLAKNVKIFGR